MASTNNNFIVSNKLIRWVALFHLLLLELIAANGKAKKADVGIAVIGAGFAGLNAARALYENGYENVTIFEATGHVGGRVWPVKYGSGFIQYGAEFVNGKANEIYQLAEQMKLITGYTEKNSATTVKAGVCTPNMHTFEEFDRFVEVLEETYTFDADLPTANLSVPVGRRFQNDYAKFLLKQSIPFGSYKRQVFDKLADLYVATFETEFAAPLSDLTVKNLVEWDDKSYAGRNFEYIMNGQGFGAILAYLTDRIPQRAILLNSPVHSVDYTDENGGVVKLTVGSKRKRVLSFDHVIVTVPLGYLKKHATKMFRPSLPAYKLNAIRKLGFGLNGKVFAEFDKPFWDHNGPSILTVQLACPQNTQPNPPSNLFTQFDPYPHFPNILLGWQGPRTAIITDRMSDDRVITIIGDTLRRAYNNQSIPNPDRLHRARWSQDPYFLGSYSYYSVDAVKSGVTYAQVAKPLLVNGVPKVLFAGEATDSTIYQTTIGAWQSGIREAQRVIRIYESAQDEF